MYAVYERVRPLLKLYIQPKQDSNADSTHVAKRKSVPEWRRIVIDRFERTYYMNEFIKSLEDVTSCNLDSISPSINRNP